MSAGGLRCDDFDMVAPEVALGTLGGSERAEALAHLASCADCQRLVAELAEVVDAMLLVAAEDDPSPGLEAGVLAQTVGDGVRSDVMDRRRRRRLLAGLAGVAAIVAVVIAAVLIDNDDDRADQVRTALAVTDGGASTCRAVINDVDPAWLFVSLDEPAEEQADDYIVELHLEEGGPVRVGRLEVRDGHGALAVTVDLDGSQARAVRLIGAGGAAEYEATFS